MEKRGAKATIEIAGRPIRGLTEDGVGAGSDVDDGNAQAVVLSRLRQAILAGELAPGARLFQEEVARQIGVSRSPVREAFLRLEAEGLVIVTPQRGAVVARLDLEEIAEIHELRAMLEGHAAQLAAERAGPELLARLRALLEEMVVAEHAGNVNVWVDLNRRFHYAIYEATGRAHLIRLIKSLAVHMTRHVHMYATIPHLIGTASDEHLQIYRALERRDGMSARNVLEHHIRRSCHDLLEHLVTRSSEPAD